MNIHTYVVDLNKYDLELRLQLLFVCLFVCLFVVYVFVDLVVGRCSGVGACEGVCDGKWVGGAIVFPQPLLPGLSGHSGFPGSLVCLL